MSTRDTGTEMTAVIIIIIIMGAGNSSHSGWYVSNRFTDPSFSRSLRAHRRAGGIRQREAARERALEITSPCFLRLALVVL